jgi:hypothetical protein
MTSMFREGTEKDKDGNIIPGPLSMRRALACLMAAAAVALFTGGLFFSANGWVVFIPGIACLLASLSFLILTTVGDVQEIIASWKGLSSGEMPPPVFRNGR